MEKLNQYKVVFYVPATALEKVKAALFQAGAGQQGNYAECCWQTLGQGQFRPLAEAKPHIGQLNKLCQVEEYKVELGCDETKLKTVIEALKASHPYEEPAFDVFRVESFY